jgi:hypothetical protein
VKAKLPGFPVGEGVLSAPPVFTLVLIVEKYGLAGFWCQERFWFSKQKIGDSQSFATRQIFCLQLARTRALADLLEDAFCSLTACAKHDSSTALSIDTLTATPTLAQPHNLVVLTGANPYRYGYAFGGLPWPEGTI